MENQTTFPYMKLEYIGLDWGIVAEAIWSGRTTHLECISAWS